MSEYEKQAEAFAEKTGTTLKTRYIGHMRYFESDNIERAVYECTLENDKHSYTFKFGQSIIKSYKIGKGQLGRKEVAMFALPFKIENYVERILTENNAVVVWHKGEEYHLKIAKNAPTLYDIFSGLEGYEIGTHEDFCNEFGYDMDSISSRETYYKVQKEYDNVCKLFNEKEREELQEIN